VTIDCTSRAQFIGREKDLSRTDFLRGGAARVSLQSGTDVGMLDWREDGDVMVRYTSKHGTTFQYDPAQDQCLYITAADEEQESIQIHFEDLKEFLDYIESLPTEHDVPTDADAAAVGPD
jgi:hypothetical protein